MSEITFQNEIQESAQKGDDTRLAESIYEYLLSVDQQGDTQKKLRTIFIAAKTSLDEKEAVVVDNVLSWTGLSPNIIGTILRTYEHATPELKQVQQEGRIGRYPAETIGRLTGSRKELQPRVIISYLKYGLTQNDLKALVSRLRRTVYKYEQEQTFAKFAPIVPATPLGQPNESAQDDETVYLFKKMQASDLERLSDNELWELKRLTGESIQKAIPILEKSLEHINEALKKRL